MNNAILGSSTDLINQILDQGYKTITSPGTAERLTSSSIHCLFVEVQAWEGNSKAIAIGGPSVLVGTGAGYNGRVGTVLQPGETKVYYIPDAILLWMDAQNTTDKVTWTIYK